MQAPAPPPPPPSHIVYAVFDDDDDAGFLYTAGLHDQGKPELFIPPPFPRALVDRITAKLNEWVELNLADGDIAMGANGSRMVWKSVELPELMARCNPEAACLALRPEPLPPPPPPLPPPPLQECPVCYERKVTDEPFDFTAVRPGLALWCKNDHAVCIDCVRPLIKICDCDNVECNGLVFTCPMCRGVARLTDLHVTVMVKGSWFAALQLEPMM